MEGKNSNIRNAEDSKLELSRFCDGSVMSYVYLFHFNCWHSCSRVV